MALTLSHSPDGHIIPPFFDPMPSPNGSTWKTLLSIANLPALLRNPLEVFTDLQYEETISKSRVLNRPLVFVHDPDFMRYLFVEKPELLRSEPVRQAVLRPMLRDGMLTAEGEVWTRSRHMIAPVFAPRHVAGFARIMDRATQRFIATMATGPSPTPLAPVMSHLTYAILSDTLFSGEFNDEAEEVLEGTDQILQKFSRPDPFDLIGAPDWMPRLSKLGSTQVIQRLRTGVRTAAESRRLRINRSEGVPEDFLTLLLKADAGDDAAAGGKTLTIEEIEDNILTFIAAGHETTARALAWTLYLLSQDPSAKRRAQAEADTLNIDTAEPANWDKHVPWITACFEEAMRLYPPAAMIARQMTKDVSFGNHRFAADTQVLVSPWILHRHSALWDSAHSFQPERFLGAQRKTIPRYSYVPFGLGHRICIGARFAMQEAVIALVHLLRSLDFEYAGVEPPHPVMKITVQPHNGLPMVITRREPGPA
ncbi:MAG: cytochrome P450 [Pseudomonadota bacterium]